MVTTGSEGTFEKKMHMKSEQLLDIIYIQYRIVLTKYYVIVTDMFLINL